MNTPSIAVLPFVDLSSGGDHRYLCDGLAAELIDSLSRTEGLRVTPRSAAFRFREANRAPEVGRELGVTAVLEGGIGETDGRLRVSVRLIRSEDGVEIWSDGFDSPHEDVLEIQHVIASRILEGLDLHLDDEQKGSLRKRQTADVRAYKHYLEGRGNFFEYGRRGVEAALESFGRALELDAEYALAHAGVAQCCSFLFMYANGDASDLERADMASRRALELAPDLAEAHASRGLVLSLQHEFDEAGEAFERAIDLNPKLFEAFYFYARNNFVKGDLKSAAKLFVHASVINPDDYQAPLLVAQIYDGDKRAQEATSSRKKGVLAAERRLEQNPEETRALYMGANALVGLGEVDKGLRWAERAMRLEPDEAMVLYNVGCVYALAGESEKALDCLERSVESGLAYVDWLRHDSNLESLREDPRFKALLELATS